MSSLAEVPDLRELVVVSFTDVGGSVPIDGERLPVSLPDYDAALNQGLADGKWESQTFDISGWPSIGGHGMVLTSQLRAEQLAKAGLSGMSPEEARLEADRIADSDNLAKLGPHARASLLSIAQQLIVVQSNCNPRTARQKEAGVNGTDWHRATTRSGVVAVGQASGFSALREAGDIMPGTFAYLPDEAAVKAGIWRKREQYTSRLAPEAAIEPKYNDLWVPASLYGSESPIGDDIKFNTVLPPDSFGNVFARITGKEFPKLAQYLREEASVGKTVVIRMTTPSGHEAQVVASVATSLQQAEHNKLNVYLNPGLYPLDENLPNEGPGVIDIVVPVDDPNDPDADFAYRHLLDIVRYVEPGFCPSDWDKTQVDFMPIN